MTLAIKTIEVIDRDLGWQKILKEVKKFKKSYAVIGYFGTGGTPDNDIAARALVNEYGVLSKKIPSRPWNREAFDKNQSNIRNMITNGLNDIYNGKSTAKRALIKIGAWYTGIVKLSLRDGNWQANSPKTIARKGSSRPLIDTGEMWGSTTHREVMK